jgi:phage terminase small subunit
MSDLTPRQERFIQEYLVDLNGTQAAIRAGYSEHTATAIGWELLRNPEVEAAIAEAKNARSARTAITADDVLREFTKVGRSDVRKLFTPEGALKPIHQLDDDTAAAISSIEVVTKRIPGPDGEPVKVEYTHKVRTYDKIAALTQAGRHLGMFVDKVAIEGRLTLEELVMAAVAKEEAEKGDHQP